MRQSVKRSTMSEHGNKTAIASMSISYVKNEVQRTGTCDLEEIVFLKFLKDAAFDLYELI